MASRRLTQFTIPVARFDIHYSKSGTKCRTVQKAMLNHWTQGSLVINTIFDLIYLIYLLLPADSKPNSHRNILYDITYISRNISAQVISYIGRCISAQVIWFSKRTCICRRQVDACTFLSNRYQCTTSTESVLLCCRSLLRNKKLAGCERLVLEIDICREKY